MQIFYYILEYIYCNFSIFHGLNGIHISINNRAVMRLHVRI